MTVANIETIGSLEYLRALALLFFSFRIDIFLS